MFIAMHMHRATFYQVNFHPAS